MKRLLATLFIAGALALGSALGCDAAERYSRSADVLPKAAREMLAKHFPGREVNHVKIDRAGLLEGQEYDVVLNDGTEVEFDTHGKWTEISCGRGASVPAQLILPAIGNYVKKHYPQAAVVQLKVERNRYEVELSNDLELDFDTRGNLLAIDR